MSSTLTTRPLTPADWSTIEALFGANGACGGCWCMYWRLPGSKEFSAGKGAGNRERFRALVEGGHAHGVLAFQGDRPVGWCAVGPRLDFVRVLRSRVLARDAGAGTWSLNCLYVPAKQRGKGVASALVEAAAAHAFALGAQEVEAYPVVPTGAGKVPAAFAWTGVPALYTRAGFTPLVREGRPVFVKHG